MSRSGYTDDYGDDDNLAMGRWRQAVRRAIEGKRGQAVLRELADVLDAMPDKRLYPGSFTTPEGEYCTLGVLGAAQGLDTSDLGDGDECDPAEVGQRFGIARAMAAEIMYLNDERIDMDLWVEEEICGPVRPRYPDWGRHTKGRSVPNENHAAQRWKWMRTWVAEHLATAPKA